MNKKEIKFVETVWTHSRRHGRQSLPWRNTQNPYRILVSEIMLQQTQVERVIPKYKSFLKRFPTLKKLSNGSLGDVLREWQGLGYNRRAKMLHQCAQIVLRTYKGRFPKLYRELIDLPGVGPYTAGAVMAFAYNIPIPVVETNIRSVFIHHFFHGNNNVHDRDILKYVARTMDMHHPREWYAALMDYGTSLKKTKGNPNSRSAQYTTQSSFKNSDRQIRGTILKCVLAQKSTLKTLEETLPFEGVRIERQLVQLLKEGLIVKHRRHYTVLQT